MWTTLIKLFWISRPVSWPNTAYPFAAGYLISGGQLDLTFVVGTLYFLGPYNLLMYGINDVFDYESDIRNPRKGGIEGMREQKAFHPTIVRASIISNVPFLLYLLMIGDATSRLALVVTVFLVLAYSLAKLRFKERPVVDSMTSSAHFVGPLVYALCLTNFPAEAWPYVVAFFLWGMASQAFGAVQDIIPDREAGLASVATFMGARTTVWGVLVLYLAAAGLVLMQGWPQAAVGVMGLAYVVNVLPYLRVTDAQSGRTNPAWRRFIWLNLVTGFVVTMVLLRLFVFG